MPPVALITDFGHRDTYVGVMKGVIAAIAPQVTCIDLTHDLPPQDIRAAQYHLLTAHPYMPQGTIYLVVVDPGVGSDRRAVAVQFPFGTVVCPDNGLLTGLLQRHLPAALQAVTLTRSAYWRAHPSETEISSTFHGRDIFAPVAAHLAAGVPLTTVGAPVAAAGLVQRSELALPQQGSRGIIQHIDHFGNLISTIPATAAQGHWQMVGDWSTSPSSRPRAIASGRSYSSVPQGELVAVVGSHGWIEVAANGTSASAILGVGVGAELAVQYPSLPSRQ